MSGRTVVMNGYNRVCFFFTESTYNIISTFLHFSVCTLYCIQFYATTITSRIDGRNRTTSKTDPIVVAAHNDDFIPCFRFTFQAIALSSETNATRQHNYFVVAIESVIFFMLER